MSLEERVDKNTQNIQKMNDVLRQLIEITSGHSDQLGRILLSIDELRESQKETQGKLNALIDAQIRGEDKTQRLDEKMAELAEIVKFAHKRIDDIEQN